MEMTQYTLNGCDLYFNTKLDKELGISTAYLAIKVINEMVGTKMETIGDYKWSKKHKSFSFMLTENPTIDQNTLIDILHKIFDCGLLIDMGFMCNKPEDDL
jgi:hypothetical protein